MCRNGGTCLSTLTGPKCHCPLQFSGRQCEEEVTVDVPGFVGNFFLQHFCNHADFDVIFRKKKLVLHLIFWGRL